MRSIHFIFIFFQYFIMRQPREVYYKATVNNGGSIDLTPPAKPNRKSQAQGLRYAVDGGGNVGKSGIPNPRFRIIYT